MTAVRKLKYNLLTQTISDINEQDPYKSLRFKEMMTFQRMNTLRVDWENHPKFSREMPRVISDASVDIAEKVIVDFYGYDTYYEYYSSEMILLLLARKSKILCQQPGKVLESIRSMSINESVGKTLNQISIYFEAVAKAIQDLKNLIKKIHSSYNVSRVIVTADHGFLFNYQELPESMFQQKPAGVHLEEHNRYLITSNSDSIKDSYTIPLSNTANVKSDLIIAVPKTINRYKRQGSGTHFVYGGGSLQEMLIPVIESSRKLVDIMKNYMANKAFSRGKDVYGATASFAFIGNTEHSVPYMFKNSNLFDALPKAFYDSAFLDRVHTYLPGWEVNKLRNEMFTNSHGFIVDYLAEILKELRKDDFSQQLKDVAELSKTLTIRDKDGITKTFSGLMKIIYPHQDYTHEDAIELLEYAIEGRKRVKDQLIKMDDTFEKVNFDYVDNKTGKTVIIETLENIENGIKITAEINDELNNQACEVNETPITLNPG